MKKILAAVLVLIMTVSMCACGGPTPSDAVTTYLDAFKAQDAETMATVYGGENDLMEDEVEYTAEVYNKILDFDYNIVNEKIDEDKATVDVEITTYDMGTAFDAIAEDVVVLIFSAAFDGTTEEEVTQKMGEMLNTEIEKLDGKEYKGTCTINLTKVDDTWVIDEFDDDSEFYRAIMGGLVESMEDLEKAFSEI